MEKVREGRAGRVTVGCQGSLPLGIPVSAHKYGGGREQQSWKLNVLSLFSVMQIKMFCRVNGERKL